MSEIRPALTAEEWAALRRESPTNGDAMFVVRDESGLTFFGVQAHDMWRGLRHTGVLQLTPGAAAAAIALANAARPDTDPGKLTWEHAQKLRDLVEWIEGGFNVRNLRPEFFGDIRALADAIASILPPREAQGFDVEAAMRRSLDKDGL